MICILICGLTTASAQQSAGTGSVEGRVFDTVTQKYLNNARITIAGTQIETYTDEYGNYRIDGVSAGDATVSVFFTGLAAQSVSVKITAGALAVKDFDLVPVGEKAPVSGDVVELEKMSVRAGGLRSYTNSELATNEQRFSTNIKSVVETTAFGDIAEGNVGEFLKYLPGVTVDYVAADVRTASVRGFGPKFTAVSFDGMAFPSAASGATSRIFEFEQVSINNVARVEVTKVPTPSSRADALGGSINYVPANAFERKGVQFNYSASLNMNSEEPNPFKKTDGPFDKGTYKVLPGFNFDLTIPFNRNFGIVVTGLTSNQYNEQHRSVEGWTFAKSGTSKTLPNTVDATPADPFLQTYVMQDGPKNSYRDSIAIRADWRIASNQTLSAGAQYNYYRSGFGNRNINFDVGTRALGLRESGTGSATQNFAYGPDYTTGADFVWTGTGAPTGTGNGKITHGSNLRDKAGMSDGANIKYRYKGHDWEFDAAFSYNVSRSWYRDGANGHFSSVNTQMINLKRVEYANIAEPRPGILRGIAFDDTVIDYTQLSNYRISTLRTQPLDARVAISTIQANVKKDIKLSFPLSIKTGIESRTEKRDNKNSQTDYTFVGADKAANTPDDAALPYLLTSYNAAPGWGLPNIQWPDAYAVWDVFANPATSNYITQTANQARDAARYEYRNNFFVKENVTSTYIQLDGKLFNGRVNFTTGVRYERTKDDADGAYAPNAGTTAAQVYTTWKKRGMHAATRYDGFYPSLHVNYNITNEIILRFAYAKTLGRPDYGSILPLVKANDTTSSQESVPAMSVEFTNPELKPYQADNIDVSLEYYPKMGGVFSVGVFGKYIKDFFEKKTYVIDEAMAEELEVDPAVFVGKNAVTYINSANTARVTGIEINARMPLKIIPGWGKYFEVFANGTKLDVDGAAESDFTGLITEAANWGVKFNHPYTTVQLNWNYRGEQMQSAQTGSAYGSTNGFKEYYRGRITLDVNAVWKLSRKFSLFANARNLLNKEQVLERRNDISPDYSQFYRAEKFGVQITLGVKGSF